jgi:hypothetical protein
MRPIPRAMLIHEATLYPSAADAGQGELPAAVRLRNIRVEPAAAQEQTDGDAHTRPSATLLYDVRNSLPKGVAFAPGQTVAFQGTNYRIETVRTLYDGRRAHHVELELSD